VGYSRSKISRNGSKGVPEIYATITSGLGGEEALIAEAVEMLSSVFVEIDRETGELSSMGIGLERTGIPTVGKARLALVLEPGSMRTALRGGVYVGTRGALAAEAEVGITPDQFVSGELPGLDIAIVDRGDVVLEVTEYLSSGNVSLDTATETLFQTREDLGIGPSSGELDSVVSTTESFWSVISNLDSDIQYNAADAFATVTDAISGLILDPQKQIQDFLASLDE